MKTAIDAQYTTRRPNETFTVVGHDAGLDDDGRPAPPSGPPGISGTVSPALRISLIDNFEFIIIVGVAITTPRELSSLTVAPQRQRRGGGAGSPVRVKTWVKSGVVLERRACVALSKMMLIGREEVMVW